MIIGVPGETDADETRVAMTPPVAERWVERGHDVLVTAGAGTGSRWADDAYADVGCEVVDDRAAVLERADVVLRVRGLAASDDDAPDAYRDGQVVVGLLGPYELEAATLDVLADRGVSAVAMELVPRISRAQSMDVLSSMASVGGYKAVMVAAEASPIMFPMEMTAAGTVRPAEVFVIGAGVAGLKAISTAHRLGASVSGYDIRLEVKQQVESLGADFVELDLETEGSGDEQGYAVEMDEAFYRQQRLALERVVADADVVITTAAIPGRPAPELVTTEMVESMTPGSVIVDLSAATGGTCEPTVADETVEHGEVTVFGPTNLPATVPRTASQLLSNNLSNLLDTILTDDGLTLDTDDAIVDATLLTHDGAVRWPDDGDGGGDEADADGEEEAADADADDEEADDDA